MTTDRRGLVVAFLVGLAGPLVVPAAGQTTPTVPAFDPAGKPKGFDAGKGPTFAVWHDVHWYLSLTANKKSKGDVFTGSVRVDKGLVIGVFDKLEKAKDAKGADWVFPHKDGGGFDFRFTNGGGVDKLQFQAGPGATSLTFNLQFNGQTLPNLVRIGKEGKHPEKVPFSLPAFP